MKAAAQEQAHLQDLDSQPCVRRFAGYLRYMGPGYLQSAMTLGSGSAFAALFAGAAFGYQLLWVAPTAMLLGIIVLQAVAWQTLSTGADPYEALKQHVHPIFAWAFAWGGLLSSLIWQFAQYAVAGAMMSMLFGITPLAGGLLALAWSLSIVLLYGRAARWVRAYEIVLTTMVWFIVGAMFIVVIRTGVPHADKVLLGFIPSVPPDWERVTADGESKQIRALLVVVSGLSAAVGANMLFVYPYTLLQRGWGRAHRRLARYDLFFGMFLPFSIAISLMVIASAAVFHYGDAGFAGSNIPPDAAAVIFASPDRLGPIIGKWIFGLGVLAMALSSINMQMLSAGYAGVKLFGIAENSWGHGLFARLPAIGVLGAVLWGEIGPWVSVPTNVICGLFLPLSFLGFTILHRRQAFLGEDIPRGTLGRAWTFGMLTAATVLAVFLATLVISQGPAYLESLLGGTS